jgi:hypothetical protein
MGVGGRAGKELTDLGLAQCSWVACLRKAEDPRGPMHGSLLGAVAGVPGTDRLLRLSRERRDRGSRVGPSRWTTARSGVSRHGAIRASARAAEPPRQPNPCVPGEREEPAPTPRGNISSGEGSRPGRRTGAAGGPEGEPGEERGSHACDG